MKRASPPHANRDLAGVCGLGKVDRHDCRLLRENGRRAFTDVRVALACAPPISQKTAELLGGPRRVSSERFAPPTPEPCSAGKLFGVLNATLTYSKPPSDATPSPTTTQNRPSHN